jgi:hypothetical protein
MYVKKNNTQTNKLYTIKMDAQSLPIVTFGKYKGKPVTEFLADTSYVEWCKKQPGMLEKNPIIYNIVVNQQITSSNQNSKTPEHNKMQNLFLNTDNQNKLFKNTFKKELDDFENKLNNLINDEDFIKHFGKYTKEKLMTRLNEGKVKFEDKYNWDLCYYGNRHAISFGTKTETETFHKKEYREKYDIEEKEKYNSNLLLVDELIELVNKLVSKKNEEKMNQYEKEMITYEEKLKKHEIELKKYLEQKKQNQIDIEKYDKEYKLHNDKLTQFKSKKEREFCTELGINYDTYKNWDFGEGCRYLRPDLDSKHTKEEKQKIRNLIDKKVDLLISSEFDKVNKKPNYVGTIDIPLEPKKPTYPSREVSVYISEGEGYEIKKKCCEFINNISYFDLSPSKIAGYKREYETRYKEKYEDEFNRLYEKHMIEYFKGITSKYFNYSDYVSVYNIENKYKISINVPHSSSVLCCELKPSLGDDYPCVLRKLTTQISLTKNDENFKKLHTIYLLIIGSFKSEAASKKQLMEIFNQSNISVLFINDIIPSSRIENLPLGQQLLLDQQLLKEGKEDEELIECEEYEYEGKTYGLTSDGDLYTQEGELVANVVNGKVIFKCAAVIAPMNELNIQQKLLKSEQEIKQLKEQTKKLEEENKKQQEENKKLKEQNKKLEEELTLLKTPKTTKTITDYFGKKK